MVNVHVLLHPEIDTHAANALSRWGRQRRGEDRDSRFRRRPCDYKFGAAQQRREHIDAGSKDSVHPRSLETMSRICWAR